MKVLTHVLCLAGLTLPAQADEIDQLIEAEMKQHGIPGLSLAVFQDEKIVLAKGYGLADAAEKTPVTSATLFQAGSVSKPVAAMGALSLVERGKLSLDDDVNAHLRSWKLPANDFTRDNKVTLRALLSHSAGVTVHGFPGYRSGGTIPTLLEVLDGQKPANTAPIRVDKTPGSGWRYSGGGYTIVQQMMIDASGQSFPAFMQEAVFKPLGMSCSSYEQPISDTLAKAAASAHASGSIVPGRFHTYPEMAAAGLWTTPSDLALWAIELQRASAGKSKVLSSDMAGQALTRQKGDSGLGVFLDREGDSLRFHHGGRNEGFDCLLFAHRAGPGAVIMLNTNDNTQVINRVLQALAKAYQWQ